MSADKVVPSLPCRSFGLSTANLNPCLLTRAHRLKSGASTINCSDLFGHFQKLISLASAASRRLGKCYARRWCADAAALACFPKLARHKGRRRPLRSANGYLMDIGRKVDWFAKSLILWRTQQIEPVASVLRGRQSRTGARIRERPR